MGTVECSYHPLSWRVMVHPPQEIMLQFFGGRLLERRDRRALRVHRTDDVPNRAVFASGIHRLKHDEQRMLRLGIQPS